MQLARENDVKKIICIGTDVEDSKNANNFALQHDDVYWTFGIHPEFAKTWADQEIKLEEKSKLVAIGEVGLDYHYDGYDKVAQIKLFEQMLKLASDHDLPVSLHIREAFADLWPILDNFPKVTGVLHSFTGSKRDLKQVLERGFFVAVNGIVTYTTTPLPPLENIVLETDAPFLTPEPYRGTINSPRYIREIALYLSEKLGVAYEVIVEQTTSNARKLFRI